MSVNLKGVIKGTIFAVLITFVIIFVLALLSYFTHVGETLITTLVYASVVIGVLMGTIAVSKAATGKIFIHAMLVCVLYLLILIGVSAIINKGITFNSHMLAIAGGTFAAGFLGSVIGS